MKAPQEENKKTNVIIPHDYCWGKEKKTQERKVMKKYVAHDGAPYK